MKENFLIFDNPKKAIYMCFALLLAVGCITVYSASFFYATNEFNNTYHFLVRYVIFGFTSVCIFLGVIKVGYKKLLTSNCLCVIGILVLLLLICVLAFGTEVNAARRWIDFRFFSIQPSEFAKLFVIMLCSSFLGKHVADNRRANIFHAPAGYCLTIAMFFGILVFVQPDMGTSAIIVSLSLFLCIVAGMRQIQIWLIVVLVGISAAVATYIAPYRLHRVLIWLNPWRDPLGDGYQMVQSQIAIGSGGWTGMDWGAGTAKFFFLPELHTDFAFAIFCQENGFLGALFLIGLFATLGYALYSIAQRAKDPTGSLLVAGTFLLVVGQAFANMAMVCGLLPIIGVPLSFISYGGSSMCVSAAALGLAVSVYNEESEIETEENLLNTIIDNQEAHAIRKWQIIKGGKQ